MILKTNSLNSPFNRCLTISMGVVTFVALFTPSFLNLDSQSLEARPCKKGLLNKLGCAVDPTNPARNGGVVQPVIVKPIQGAVKRYARRTACTTAGAVTGAALASSGAATSLTVIGGTLAADQCYRVWKE